MLPREMSWRPSLLALAFVGLICSGAFVGCTSGERAKVMPVSGKVLFNGQPLAFGAVAFQPMRGQPARGTIGKDGTFKLSTYREGDGAAVGQHRVKITCYTSQDPATKKPGPSETLGESLIPARYANFDTSGLTVAVLADGNSPFMFELKSEAQEGETAQGGEAKQTPAGVAKPADRAAKPTEDAAPSADHSGPSAPAEATATPEPAGGAPPADAKTDGK